jgi:hypothetical protein
MVAYNVSKNDPRSSIEGIVNKDVNCTKAATEMERKQMFEAFNAISQKFHVQIYAMTLVFALSTVADTQPEETERAHLEDDYEDVD